jgi:hypothetical protein
MLCALTDTYQDSSDSLGLADRTRQDYTKLVKLIVTEFGEMPIAALADRRTRAEFMTWRDGLAKKSRCQADYAWTVLARILSWSVDRGLSDANPYAKGGRLYSGSRADKTWSVDGNAVTALRPHDAAATRNRERPIETRDNQGREIAGDALDGEMEAATTGLSSHSLAEGVLVLLKGSDERRDDGLKLGRSGAALRIEPD